MGAEEMIGGAGQGPGAGLGLLAEALEGVMLIRAQDGTVLYANHALELRAGVGTGALVGRAARTLGVEPEAPELARTGMWSGQLAASDPEARVTVVEFEHPDLSRTWLAVLHPPLEGTVPWQVALEAELRAARHGDHPLAVGAVGLDGAGDRDLAMAAWRAAMRAQDSISWLAQDCALFWLPGCQMEGASMRAQRLLDATPAGTPVTIGLAFWDKQEGADDLVARARDTLRQAQSSEPGQIAFAPRRTSR
ncbi:MAG TPA: hypothetical protein VGN69_05855 [Solirubrobacteraceae bacterium]|jgi:hypothetical protein|nr:hypothetical protein [Solirubrobacteraceae bacterium]